jgi:hypothetical protein
MSAPRRSFAILVVFIVTAALAALSFTGLATGAQTKRAPTNRAPATVAAVAPAAVAPAFVAPAAIAPAAADTDDDAPRLCGGKFYPPCPPRGSISVSHRTVHAGHKVHIRAKHFAAHKTVTIHLVGHGHSFFLGKVVTGKHGSVSFSVRIPRHLKPGTYTLVIQVGSTTKRIHIVVKR